MKEKLYIKTHKVWVALTNAQISDLQASIKNGAKVISAKTRLLKQMVKYLADGEAQFEKWKKTQRKK